MSTVIDRPATEPESAPASRTDDALHTTIGAYAWFEGKYVPFADANVSIATHAFNYGTAVFEGIRAYRQHDGGLAILFALEHYQRMLRNGRLLRASVPQSAEDLVEITAELLRRNGDTRDQYIRPLLYKAAHAIRLQLSDLDDRICIFTLPMGDYVATEGLRVAMSAWQRVNDNAVPARGKITGSYVNACLAVEDAHAGGYGEAVLLTAEGHVAEASSANLFVVFEGRIETPPLSDDVLAGVTRGAVMAARARPRLRGGGAQDRPHGAAARRRGVLHRHRRADRGGGLDRQPAGRRRLVLPGHEAAPGDLLPCRARAGSAVRQLADPGVRALRAFTGAPPQATDSRHSQRAPCVTFVAESARGIVRRPRA